ncbi:MAG: glycine--tRNA ligase subunit beta, partial [Longimicrobiales bacterium]
MIRLADIHAARERLRGGIVHTPCKHTRAFQDLVPAELHFKFENLQRTGSFKDRGALNRLLQLTPEERKRGVVTASAGNHAQAVAYHASRLGICATVVMPEFTPFIKVTNTRGYGARVIQMGATLSDGLKEVYRMVEEDGMNLVHAFDDDAVIAGQGTIGLELVEQVEELSTVVVPIGGGGIISGIADELIIKDLSFSLNQGKMLAIIGPNGAGKTTLLRCINAILKPNKGVVEARKGPAEKAAFDADGNPTRAAEGFARSVGLKVDQLDRLENEQGRWLYAEIEQPGKTLAELLPDMLDKVVREMAGARSMRWSDRSDRFLRPVRWLVVLHGAEVVPVSLFGLDAGRETRGHRIHAPGEHPIATVEDYEPVLEQACV